MVSPLLRDDSLDPVEFTRGIIQRFEYEVATALSPYFLADVPPAKRKSFDVRRDA